VKENYPKLNY